MFESLRWSLARRRCRLPLEQPALAQPLPRAGQRLKDLELVALDFETTGLDAGKDQILSAGWVCIRGDRLLLASAREVHVRPEGSDGVGQSAVIHGIVDSDLAQAGDAETMLRELLPALAGRAVVAHAATIERGFLDGLLCAMGGVRLPHRFVDTLALERHLLDSDGARGVEPELHLQACRARYGLPAHNSHSALADAVACAELLLAQVERMGGAARVRLGDLR